MTWTDITRVELFHLQLLRLLGTGPVKSHIALKGGCNLRFFFGSVRYSEDMDLDVAPKLEAYALRERMDGILAGAALHAALRSANVEITRVSAPKQTDTTQRWKIGLRARDRAGVPLHTKVEFSRRPAREHAVLEAVSPAVLSRYALLPVLVSSFETASSRPRSILRRHLSDLLERFITQECIAYVRVVLSRPTYC